MSKKKRVYRCTSVIGGKMEQDGTLIPPYEVFYCGRCLTELSRNPMNINKCLVMLTKEHCGEKWETW